MGVPRRVVLNPPVFDRSKTLGEKIDTLARIAPADVKAIEILVDDALRRRLWEIYDGIKATKPRL